MNWRFKYVEFGFVVLVTASFTLSCAWLVSARLPAVSMLDDSLLSPGLGLVMGFVVGVQFFQCSL